MIDYMSTLFIEGLAENDIAKLLAVPKSDIHNHSTKGCRRVWLEEQIKLSIPKTPKKNMRALTECINGSHLRLNHIVEE